MLPNMGKKTSKRLKASRADTQTPDASSRCPYCGITKSEKSALYLMDRLVRSHTELCAALRLAGRQMLRFETQNDGSLERIRKVLKHADNMSKVLEMPEEAWGAARNLRNIDEFTVEAPTSAAESSPKQGTEDNPIRKSVQRRPRRTRLNLPLVVKFPTV